MRYKVQFLLGYNRLKDDYVVIELDNVTDKQDVRFASPKHTSFDSKYYVNFCCDKGWDVIGYEVVQNPWETDRIKHARMLRERYKENPPQITGMIVDKKMNGDVWCAEVEYKSGIKRMYLKIPKTVINFMNDLNKRAYIFNSENIKEVYSLA